MLVYSFFKGDKTNSQVYNMQFEMYSYIISHMFQEIKILYLNNPYTELYLDEERITSLSKIETFDHRLMQTPHDCFAAVFRYKFVMGGEFQKELLSLEEEQILKLFNSKFIDVDFLEKIEKSYWFLTVKWFDFITEEINKSLSISRQIALSVLENNTFETDSKFAWEASRNAEKLIKLKYNTIPWTI